MQDIPVVFDRPVTLVGGGPVDRLSLADARALAPALVAADRAADTLAALGALPELLVGDMDSVGDLAAWRRVAGTRVLHLVEQETTDFEKCLYATEAPWYLAAGFTGGRLDHTLAVLHAMLARPEKRVVLLAEEDAIVALPPGRTLSVAVEPGARVSLFPLGPASGTHSRGLVWPVTGLDMAPGRLIGTSNRAEAGRVEVAFDAPGVFLILPRTHLPDLVAAMLSV